MICVMHGAKDSHYRVRSSRLVKSFVHLLHIRWLKVGNKLNKADPNLEYAPLVITVTNLMIGFRDFDETASCSCTKNNNNNNKTYTHQ